MIDKILAVIVLYKENLETSLTYQSLLMAVKQVNQSLSLLIYDNSPTSNLILNNQPLLNIEYIGDQTNSGISKAYNIASKIALEQEKKWLLLLDQDSILPQNFLELLSQSILKHSNEVIFAPILKQKDVILSPCKFSYKKGSAFKNINSGILHLKNISVLNSGMCVNLNMFIQLGGYDENIKLDFSDHYFINKVKTIYDNIYVLPVIIKHKLSSNSPDEEIILKRFDQYCYGANEYLKVVKNQKIIIFWTFLRGFKLSIYFRSFKYLIIFFKYFS